MPSVLWVSLPEKWKLEEVQAGLQVVVAVLCTSGIFAFSRFCWQLSSNLVKKNQAVALSSLMSISTMGEAFDIIALLKRRIFRQRYWKLLAQSVVVVSLTVATIVSGPIAKASTRMGLVVRIKSIPGLLATNDFNSRSFASVDWNQTSNSLNRAAFPLDQLLDYMPQHDSNWLYRPEEWNNTWTMDCKKTENTPVSIFGTGVCNNYSTEIPATNSFFNYDEYNYWTTDWYGSFSNDIWLDDGLVAFTGWTWPRSLNATAQRYEMTITVALLRIHHMSTSVAGSRCSFGRGEAQSASYTKMECSLKRPRTIPDEYHIAFPDCTDYFALPQAYVQNYFDRFATEANTNKQITIISPDELIRFYQTYIITKDYQYPHPVSRQLTTNVRLVQLSSTFIAFGSLYALLVIMGLCNFGIFAFRNRQVIRETPVSKLDWIVQSVIDEAEATKLNRKASRRSVIGPTLHPEETMRDTEKVRSVFENAKYGSTTVEEIALTNSTGSYNDASYNHSATPSYGFKGGPTAHGGYVPEVTTYDNSDPFDDSHTTQRTSIGRYSSLRNPENIFTSDRARGYQRIG